MDLFRVLINETEFYGLLLIRTLKRSITCNLLLSKSAIRTLSHWRSMTCSFLMKIPCGGGKIDTSPFA